jgi:hypothetical protein
MILQFGVLVQMWLTAPMMARSIGGSAYAIALLFTCVTFAIYLYIAEDDMFWGEPRAVPNPERQDVRARLPHNS